MSVISRENLIDFDKFAYGSAQSTLLFLIIALSVADLHLARQGRPRRAEAMTLVKSGLFDLAVVVIVVVAVFPFYYAIITSLKSGTALFEVNYLPREFNFAQLCQRDATGRVSAQHPELGLRRLDDGGAGCCCSG